MVFDNVVCCSEITRRLVDPEPASCIVEQGGSREDSGPLRIVLVLRVFTVYLSCFLWSEQSFVVQRIVSSLHTQLHAPDLEFDTSYYYIVTNTHTKHAISTLLQVTS